MHWFVCITLSFFPPSIPALRGLWQRELKTKARDRNTPVQSVSEGSRRWRIPHSYYPLSLSGPRIRARECAGAQETLRSVYGMPRCLLSTRDARCFILQHTHTQSHRHRPILPPNKTIIKQHARPPGPIKAFYTREPVKEGKIISSLIMVLIPYG